MSGHVEFIFSEPIPYIGYDSAYEIVQIAKTIDIVGFEES